MNLAPDHRLSAIARILAQGFLRLQPSKLERLRSAAEKNANSSGKGTYSLETGGDESVHRER